MNRYFVRIDYQYKCSPIQRVRLLVNGLSGVKALLSRYSGDDYSLLSMRVEYVVV